MVNNRLSYILNNSGKNPTAFQNLSGLGTVYRAMIILSAKAIEISFLTVALNMEHDALCITQYEIRNTEYPIRNTQYAIRNR